MPAHTKRLSTIFDYFTPSNPGNPDPPPALVFRTAFPQTTTMTSLASPNSPLPPEHAAPSMSRSSRRSSRSSDAHSQAELASSAAQGLSSGRRKSQPHIANPARALPYPAIKPTRRPSQHAHTQSASASPTDRRGSLPSLHLRSSSQRTANEPAPPVPELNYDTLATENPGSDYSSLQSFTFGVATGSSARPSYDADSLSPLATSPALEDRTPRPSIFRARDDDPNDKDEQERCQRAKMRAIDYGERRPSLPMNLAASSAVSLDNDNSDPSTSEPRSSPTPPPDATSAPERTSLSDVELDASAESDVEYGSEADGVSIRTFGIVSDKGKRTTRQFVTPWEFQDTSVAMDEDEAVDPNSMASSRRASVQNSTRTVNPAWGWNPDQDPNRDREGSVATIRKPSDVGDRLQDLHIQSPGSQSQFQQSEASSSQAAWEGLDLNYIIGSQTGVPDSRRSSLSFAQPLSPPPQKKKGKKDKVKGKGQATDINELLAADPAIAPWGDPNSRRPSQATISGDDTFERRLREQDQDYGALREAWSFIQQNVNDTVPGQETATSTGRRVKSTAIYRCAQIGLVRTERSVVPSSDPSRRPAERLNVYHIPDPSSEGNQVGGPGMLVHKHSRAKAFAMYRFYDLHTKRSAARSTRTSSSTAPSNVESTRSSHRNERQAQTSLPLNKGILLAPKSVMTQFTNTHSTRNLEDHGLLSESRSSRAQGGQRGERERRARSASRERPRDGEHRSRLPGRPPLPFQEPRHIIDPKSLSEIVEQSMAAATPPAAIPNTPPSSGSSTAYLVQRSSPGAHSEITQVPTIVVPPNTRSRGSSVVRSGSGDEDEADEDEEDTERRLGRQTTHAEAYGTLDAATLERLRQGGLEDKGRSTSWLQRFRGAAAASTRTQPGSFAPIRPPWVTLAPRGQQEEQAVAIKTLNTSFVDVGLLPSYRKKAGNGIGRQGAGKHAEALTNVPDEALCMLLPLWPKETDPESAVLAAGERVPEPPAEERLYLLVYFERFEGQGKERAHSVRDGVGGSGKKRPRAGEREGPSTTVVFDCFKVTARLMSYDDLKGSNVRLPVHGLSVTGPLDEARRGIPPASLRELHQDDFVIALCANRQNGIVEFLPDGLDKLGLCLRGPEYVRMSATQQQTHRSLPEEETVPLTPVGRAAVEMIWLACMSLTSFSDA